jgi:hypothetical protein
MNPKFVLALALLAAICHVGSGQITLLGAGLLGGALAVSSGSNAAILAAGGAAALLKAKAVIAVSIANGHFNGNRLGRKKRSPVEAETEQAMIFAAVQQVEPQQCIRRLICDLASGQMAKSDNDVILALFAGKEPSMANPAFEYSVAAKLGKELKNIEACEIRYSCPVTGSQLSSIVN